MKILLFIISFVILTSFKIDPDLGWHLAYGRDFLASGRIIGADPFSWTMPGYVWGNSYLLFQVFVSLVLGKFGHIVLGVIFGAVASLAVVVVSKKLDLIKLVLIGFVCFMAVSNLGVRPHTMSFLLFGLLLLFLEKRHFQKLPHSFFWFGLFALWANLHRGFVVGLLVLASFMAVDFIWLKAKKKKPSVSARLICLVAAFLGTLATPISLDIWHSAVVLDLTSQFNLTKVAEWQPAAIFFPANLLFAATGLIFTYVFFKKSKEVEPAWFLLAGCLFAFAFLASAFIFFWVITFIFIICRYLDINFYKKWDFWARFPLIFSAVATLAVVALHFLAHTIESYDLTNRLIADEYPVLATEKIREHEAFENIFNEYAWGGYLDWQLSETKVFIDGRMASWRVKGGTHILADYLEISEGNCAVFDKYNIKTVLVSKNFNLACFSGFRGIYEDDVAKVLVR